MEECTLVVLSGGQDSTTILFWALEHFKKVQAVTFDYGQRHYSEIAAAREIAEHAGVDCRMIDLRGYGGIAVSALTDHTKEISVDGGLNGLPSTFTPGRNIVFLSVAASFAASAGCESLVTGVCQTDYSGYPDCRRTTIDALETALQLGIGLPKFKIYTPLMYLTKADTVRMAKSLGDHCWAALAHSVTCYSGDRPGCGTCPSCLLRAKGFQEAGLADPSAA